MTTSLLHVERVSLLGSSGMPGYDQNHCRAQETRVRPLTTSFLRVEQVSIPIPISIDAVGMETRCVTVFIRSGPVFSGRGRRFSPGELRQCFYINGWSMERRKTTVFSGWSGFPARGEGAPSVACVLPTFLPPRAKLGSVREEI